jgi:hypothetical protein
MSFLCFIMPVKFVGYHSLLPICSLPKIRMTFSMAFATIKAR